MKKRRLGEELRRLRETSGVPAEQAAAELDCTVGKIRHIEGGRNAPSKSDLTVLCGLYGASKGVHAVLESIRKGASQRGWWSTYKLPNWLHLYVGAESDAHTVRTIQLELIPGLLQTEAYARAMHDLAGVANADKLVEARLKRQERLLSREPLTLQAVISEAAIRRAAVEDFAAEQFRHLLAMARRPNVSLRILPFSTGLHMSVTSGFVLLDFHPEVGAPSAYLEHANAGQLVDDATVVRHMTDVFAAVRAQALSEKESGDFIEQTLAQVDLQRAGR
jgi:transcriptional regulator with XRE-family HTH domain